MANGESPLKDAVIERILNEVPQFEPKEAVIGRYGHKDDQKLVGVVQIYGLDPRVHRLIMGEIFYNDETIELIETALGKNEYRAVVANIFQQFELRLQQKSPELLEALKFDRHKVTEKSNGTKPAFNRASHAALSGRRSFTKKVDPPKPPRVYDNTTGSIAKWAKQAELMAKPENLDLSTAQRNGLRNGILSLIELSPSQRNLLVIKLLSPEDLTLEQIADKMNEEKWVVNLKNLRAQYKKGIIALRSHLPALSNETKKFAEALLAEDQDLKVLSRKPKRDYKKVM